MMSIALIILFVIFSAQNNFVIKNSIIHTQLPDLISKIFVSKILSLKIPSINRGAKLSNSASGGPQSLQISLKGLISLIRFV